MRQLLVLLVVLLTGLLLVARGAPPAHVVRDPLKLCLDTFEKNPGRLWCVPDVMPVTCPDESVFKAHEKDVSKCSHKGASSKDKH